MAIAQRLHATGVLASLRMLTAHARQLSKASSVICWIFVSKASEFPLTLLASHQSHRSDNALMFLTACKKCCQVSLPENLGTSSLIALHIMIWYGTLTHDNRCFLMLDLCLIGAFSFLNILIIRVLWTWIPLNDLRYFDQNVLAY